MRGWLVLGAVLVLLAACGLQPAPFPTPTSEMEPRPGIISGPTGDVVLYRQ